MPDTPDNPLIERIRERLATHVPVVDETSDARAAAVALVLRPRGADVDILFITRAEYELDPWSGQVAFPGGRREPADGELLETALRETMEEIGIDLRGRFALLGRLDDLRSKTVKLPNVFVRPFVLKVGDIEGFQLSPEVADAFWVPLSFLTTASSWKPTKVRARGLLFDVNACHFEGRIIWGMTERILSQLLHLAVSDR